MVKARGGGKALQGGPSHGMLCPCPQICGLKFSYLSKKKSNLICDVLDVYPSCHYLGLLIHIHGLGQVFAREALGNFALAKDFQKILWSDVWPPYRSNGWLGQSIQGFSCFIDLTHIFV